MPKETIIIIGGGPAGYVAALTAARYGQEVILIEEKKVGGTCLNEGCIPTKTLLETADLWERLKRANTFGLRLPLETVQIDWPQALRHKAAVVQRLVTGLHYLLKKGGVRVIQGTAVLADERTVLVQGEGGKEKIVGDRIILATGSEPVSLPFAPFDGTWVIHSSHALDLLQIPKSLLIIGGGAIGCEFASLFSRLGCEVTLVEMAGQLLPGEDADVSAILQKRLEKDGVQVLTSTTIQEVDHDSRTVRVVNASHACHVLTAEKMLVAIGRRPRLEGLGLERAGIQYNRRGISVNEYMQTNLSHIFACGDVVGGTQLAHLAFREGAVAAANACGRAKPIRRDIVPRCIYTHPEIARVGWTEREARERWGDVLIGEYPFVANGRALSMDETEGRIKVIVRPEIHEIVGISIVGPRATKLIGQGALLLYAEMTADSMEDFIVAHPTLAEALQEAVLQVTGKAVHR